jgi:hypothetical protein
LGLVGKLPPVHAAGQANIGKQQINFQMTPHRLERHPPAPASNTR